MNIQHIAPRPGHGRRAAFSLVEVALALGIVGFALAGLIGAIPLAANTGRQSIAQSRAASIASTIFANLRSQPFGAALYLDSPATNAVNLNTRLTDESDTASDPNKKNLTFFAVFDEVASTAPTDDARRLHFVDTAPASGIYYQVVLRFNNKPAGMLAPYQASPPTTTNPSPALHAEASLIEATISASDSRKGPISTSKGVQIVPLDVYRFNSVIANRSE